MNDNIFADLPILPEELERFQVLFQHPGLRIEKIVSTGQTSPSGAWYDQADGEWILLLQGSASLRFDGEDHARILRPGDFLNIEPHRRHRVESTDITMATVWLAVHYSNGSR